MRLDSVEGDGVKQGGKKGRRAGMGLGEGTRWFGARLEMRNGKVKWDGVSWDKVGNEFTQDRRKRYDRLG